MSDFLTQFTSSNYLRAEEVDDQHCSDDVLAAEADDDAAVPKRTRTRSSNTGQKIAGAAHKVERDDKHHKRKVIRYGIIAGSVGALCLLTAAIFYFANRVEVKDFVGSPVAEARTWGLSHRITIEVTEEFSVEFDQGIVTKQDRAAQTSLQRGSVLRLHVSKGPDPDERIILPDFASMTTAEVRDWRQEVKALNANINEEYSDEVEKGHFIRLEFTSSFVSEENYLRKDGLLIYMSKGAETFEANIVVPNFIEQTKHEVEAWAKEHGVKPVFVEESSESLAAGQVIAQSIEAGTRIAKNDELIITVSLGRFVIVPNFNNLTMEEATSISGLLVETRRRYSATIPFGRVISQSERAGTEILADSVQIVVIYSLGRPYIDNLMGESERTLAEYFYNFSSQGANISYQIVYVDSAEPRGTIVAMSKYAQFLNMSDHVRISVSRGNLTPPSD
ncbi:MAG: PASTA domain-containing protein [Coriobacteriia bacterium]|nr:PASTA domain-containing protein [Coriobacteriia bacterium]